VTAWTEQDYERAVGQDAGEVTASPLALQAEYQHGAATAWQLTEHSAANGRDAGYIEQRHEELSGPERGETQRTPAEHAWHSGYKSGAGGSVSLLRELELEAG
jgi:hypothetical protein